MVSNIAAVIIGILLVALSLHKERPRELELELEEIVTMDLIVTTNQPPPEDDCDFYIPKGK